MSRQWKHAILAYWYYLVAEVLIQKQVGLQVKDEPQSPTFLKSKNQS